VEASVHKDKMLAADDFLHFVPGAKVLLGCSQPTAHISRSTWEMLLEFWKNGPASSLDVMGDSGFPSVTQLWQELNSAGSALIAATLAATAATVAPTQALEFDRNAAAAKVAAKSNQSGAALKAQEGLQEQLVAVLDLLEATKQKLDQRLEGAVLSFYPGVDLLAPEDSPPFTKAALSKQEDGSVHKDGMLAADVVLHSTKIGPAGSLDVTGVSRIPSVTQLLQELRSAGSALVAATLAATVASVAPTKALGFDRNAAASFKTTRAAFRRQELLNALRSISAASDTFLRLAKTLTDMSNLAGRMLALLPAEKGANSAAAAMMRQLAAAAAAVLPRVVKTLSFGAAFSDILSAWSSYDQGSTLCEDDIMPAIHQLFDRLHGCGKELLQGVGDVMVVRLGGAAKLGLSIMDVAPPPSLSKLSEMTAMQQGLVDALGILYGPLVVPQGEPGPEWNPQGETAD
jgi:hypothetical protein